MRSLEAKLELSNNVAQHDIDELSNVPAQTHLEELSNCSPVSNLDEISELGLHNEKS